jgi:hypothetical protein
MTAIAWYWGLSIAAYALLTPVGIWALLTFQPELSLTRSPLWLICLWWWEMIKTTFNVFSYHLNKSGGKT